MIGLMTGFIGRVAAIMLFLAVQAGVAGAGELKVFSTIGMKGALEQLAPQFEKTSGNTLAITWATAAMLVKRIEAGESADVVILTRAGIDALSKEGKIAPGSQAFLASSGIAVAVKAGAPKPDISTPEALKQTLLAAKSIAYADPTSGGASGVYFAKALEQLGIADAMKAKTKFPPPGGNPADLVVAGEADLAAEQKTEALDVPGTEVAGVLPGDLNHVTAFAAGIEADSKNAETAAALIKLLQSPEAAAVFRARGYDLN